MGSVGDSLSLHVPIQSARPQILFIDAYDSFSNNITSLLSTLLDADVFVLTIDDPISKEDFGREIRNYDAVVCGPGPGSPGNDADVGLMNWLWELEGEALVPVLGVCLGFQSLVLACGGNIRRLRRGLHGMVRAIEHRAENVSTRDEGNIFESVANFKATLYHSLCADVGQDSIANWHEEKWNCPAGLPDIVPLAWVEEDRHDGSGAERILMALKHRRKPFWGLQYHPESVCTEEEGKHVVRNWLQEALRWNTDNGRTTLTDRMAIRARNAVRPSLLQQAFLADQLAGKGEKDFWPRLIRDQQKSRIHRSQNLYLPSWIEVPDIVEILKASDSGQIILDSANGNQPPPERGLDVRGRFSIIAMAVDDCIRIEHHTGENFVTVVLPGAAAHKVTLSRGQNVWHLIAEFHEAGRSSIVYGQEMPCGETEIPFLAGFVGYVTYEQGLRDIDIALLENRGHRRPDVCLAWVTQSIVLDHQDGVLHIQEFGDGTTQWMGSVATGLQSYFDSHSESRKGPAPLLPSPSVLETTVDRPEQACYEAKVRTCQDYIAAGESYELCLTDQTNITRVIQPITPSGHYRRRDAPSHTTASDDEASSWHLYRTLRQRNPAPFSSYLRLGGATLVSSSPERFLRYDATGLCSMKPMKGTVRKKQPSSPGLEDDGAATLAEAEALLRVPKEEAENLMIVDLVRHDLHGVCGAGRVSVPELLKVEEYQTVFTMITTVEGRLPPRGDGAGLHPSAKHRGPADAPCGSSTGLDVLSASLPPGSMTGAPKKRSCEILRQIEGGKERSLYSGVVGYMCVSGRGDWSVTIRSMFRWDDERGTDEKGNCTETWHIGAGGAVTILSTPEGESEEMFVKLARPLSIFDER